VNRRAADTDPGSTPGVRIAIRGKHVQPGVVIADEDNADGDNSVAPVAAAISAAPCSHCQLVVLVTELVTW
jgi:hypothetical protein